MTVPTPDTSGAAAAGPMPAPSVHGHRVQGAISGFAFGLGVAILLQQFGIVPLTAIVLIVLPLAGAIAGLGLGWPRGVSPT